MTARNARTGVSIDLQLGKAVVPAWEQGWRLEALVYSLCWFCRDTIGKKDL